MYKSEQTQWADLGIAYEYECQCGAVNKHKTDCMTCYQRRYHGSVKYYAKNDEITYDAMHHRVRVAKGKASDYDCIITDGGIHPAGEWALQEEPTHWSYRNERDYGYVLDVEAYSPMCRKHHRLMDGGK